MMLQGKDVVAKAVDRFKKFELRERAFFTCLKDIRFLEFDLTGDDI